MEPGLCRVRQRLEVYVHHDVNFCSYSSAFLAAHDNGFREKMKGSEPVMDSHLYVFQCDCKYESFHTSYSMSALYHFSLFSVFHSVV